MFDKRGTVPTAMLIAELVGAWFLGRAVQPNMAIGFQLVAWLMLTLVLATLVTIASVASAMGSSPQDRPGGQPGTVAFFCFALIADACGLLIILFGLSSNAITFIDCLQLYALLIAWLGFVAAATAFLARFNVGLAVTLASTLSMITLAAPVALVPIVRQLAGTPYQTQFVQAITYFCPTLSMLEAIRPSITFAWAQMPVMYALTPLGQDVPMALAPWHMSLYVWGIPAVLITAGLLLLRRRSV